MQKKTGSISISVMAVLIALTCLLLSLVVGTNSWFTSELNQVLYFDVKISSLSINVYKDSVATGNEVYTYSDNQSSGTDKYISLSKEILPDETNSLTLLMTNEDVGTELSYLRFKLELIESSTEEVIPIEISGYTASSASANGFAKNDGWFYYQKNGANVVFEKNASVTLLTSFVVPYSSFMGADGTIKLDGSETVKLVLTVQNSIDGVAFA